MSSIFLLTQSANSILRPIARALGLLMNGIYNLMDSLFNVQNVALTVVIFTVIIYIIMLPLTIQQQKFSKMSQIMNPEIQAVQKKYRGKRDTASQQAQQAETQAIYRKYGVRPSGSCVFLVIQFLILIPLYRVIYSVPGYVTRVKETFTELVTDIMMTDGYQTTLTDFFERISENNSVMRQVTLVFDGTQTEASDSIIDMLYRCTSDNWHELAQLFPSISDVVQTTQTAVEHFTSFLSASIVYSPIVLIRTSAASGDALLVFIGVLIPIISAASQFLSVRLMPQANTGAGDQMGSQMRMMNYIMPIYSFFIVFFLPIGIGIYWITGAIIRIVQQFFINRYFDRIDMAQVVEQNKQKAEEREKKRVERKGVSSEELRSAARINTRQINAPQQPQRSMSDKAASVSKASSSSQKSSGKSSSNKSSSNKSSTNKSNANKSNANKNSGKQTPASEENEQTKKPKTKYKEGSMAALANKVTEYNEKNSKSK